MYGHVDAGGIVSEGFGSNQEVQTYTGGQSKKRALSHAVHIDESEVEEDDFTTIFEQNCTYLKKAIFEMWDFAQFNIPHCTVIFK